MARPNDHLPDTIAGRTVSLVSYADEWTLAADVTLAAVPTSYTSAPFDITSVSGAWVHIFIDSTGAPTNVRVLVQFSDDGYTWWDFEEGLWASLYWEDADTAAGIHKAYLLPCAGQNLMRFCITGTGTAADATFWVMVKFRPFRGAYGMAHA